MQRAGLKAEIIGDESLSASAGPIRRYPTQWFSRDEGLNSSQIHDIAFSSDQRMWAVSPSGLVCYDGVRITTFGQEEGLHCHGLRAIAIDGNDVLWLGSDEGLQRVAIGKTGIARVSWHPIGVIDQIRLDGERAAIGTPHGLFLYAEGIGPIACRSADLRNAVISDVSLGQGSEINIVGPKIGLLQWRGDGWRTPAPRLDDHHGKLSSIAQLDNGALAVGGATGFSILAADGSVTASESSEAPISALVANGGTIIVAKGNALVEYRIVDGKLMNGDCLIRDVKLNNVTPDEFNNLWLASENCGIGRISAMRHIISYPQIAMSGAVMSIAEGPGGNCYGGTEGLLLPSGRVTLAGVKVWDVRWDKQGILWAASESGLQCLANPNVPVLYHRDSEVLSSPCRVILPAAHGLLVGSTRGLALIRKDKVEELKAPNGKSIGYVYSLLADQTGLVWICTLGAGLWTYDGETIARPASPYFAKNCNVYAAAQSANGDIFVAHDNSISRINADGTSKVIYRSNETIAAWALICDPSDKLFAGTTKGLVEIDKSTGNEVSRILDRSDQVNWEFTTSRSLRSTGDGTLICGLASGLAEVTPDQFESLASKPMAALHHVKWIGTEPLAGEPTTAVEEGKWRVVFEVKTNWYIDESECVMRFRLLGFDENWSEFGRLSQITYSSLPAGEYTLEVQMQSPFLGCGETAHVVTFEVRRRRIPLFAALQNAVPALFDFRDHVEGRRKKRLSDKNFELEQLIRERTVTLMAMNEDMKQAHEKLDELAYKDSLTGASNRRKFEDYLEAELEDGLATGAPVSLLLIDVDHFKLFNDTYGHVSGDDALKSLAAALCGLTRSPADLVARIGGEEFAIVLPDTNLEDAEMMGARVVAGIAKLEIPNRMSPTHQLMTVSVGVAAVSQDISSRRSLMLAADEALYAAKSAGRNCVKSSTTGVA